MRLEMAGAIKVLWSKLYAVLRWLADAVSILAVLAVAGFEQFGEFNSLKQSRRRGIVNPRFRV